jgi:hypothetical protein
VNTAEVRFAAAVQLIFRGVSTPLRLAGLDPAIQLFHNKFGFQVGSPSQVFSPVMTQVMWKRIAHHFAVMLAVSGTPTNTTTCSFFSTSTR